MPSARFQKLAAEAKSRVREVTANEASRRQKEGALLIDVREAEEFAKGHAAGAIHLSKGVIELKIEDAAPDVASPIVC
jgi:phage shock protein E